jgi:integrase
MGAMALRYTGGRINELMQLRRKDLMKVDDLHCIRITPEAGTVKDAKERIVRLKLRLGAACSLAEGRYVGRVCSLAAVIPSSRWLVGRSSENLN